MNTPAILTADHPTCTDPTCEHRPACSAQTPPHRAPLSGSVVVGASTQRPGALSPEPHVAAGSRPRSGRCVRRTAATDWGAVESSATHVPASAGGATARLAELVAALSLGVDLGFGQPMEHVLR